MILKEFIREFKNLGYSTHNDLHRIINLGKNYDIRLDLVHAQNNLFKLTILDKYWNVCHVIQAVTLRNIFNSVKNLTDNLDDIRHIHLDILAKNILTSQEEE